MICLSMFLFLWLDGVLGIKGLTRDEKRLVVCLNSDSFAGGDDRAVGECAEYCGAGYEMEGYAAE